MTRKLYFDGSFFLLSRQGLNICRKNQRAKLTYPARDYIMCLQNLIPCGIISPDGLHFSKWSPSILSPSIFFTSFPRWTPLSQVESIYLITSSLCLWTVIFVICMMKKCSERKSSLNQKNQINHSSDNFRNYIAIFLDVQHLWKCWTSLLFTNITQLRCYFL